MDIIDSLVDDVHEALLADFPEIIGIKDEFQCFDYDGIHDLCAVCAEIDACIHGLDSNLHAANSDLKTAATVSACVDCDRSVSAFLIHNSVLCETDQSGSDSISAVAISTTFNFVDSVLATGIIYPISDSKWVSPVQVVPKDVLRKIYRCRLERARVLMRMGLLEDVRWIIEAKKGSAIVLGI